MCDVKKYSIKHLYTGLLDGSIGVDFGDHNSSFRNLDNRLADFREKVQHRDEHMRRLMEHDPAKNGDDEEMRDRFRAMYEDDHFEVGEELTGISSFEYFCFDCGKRSYLELVAPDRIGMIHYDLEPDPNAGERWKFIKTNTTRTCPGAALVKGRVLRTEIDVPTGKLVFGNYFRADAFDDPKELHKGDVTYNLSALTGRNDIMQYHAAKNVGYAQMGNMGFEVYASKKKDAIILGTDYYYDEEKEEEVEVKHQGFSSRGHLSLGVWRWMCADRSVLEAAGEELPADLGSKATKQRDWVQVDVTPGKWVIEHYYEFEGRDNPVYSRLFRAPNQ